MTKPSLNKILLAVLVLFVMLVVISCVIIPRIHKKVSSSSPALYPEDKGERNERVLCVDDNRDALVWRLRAIEEAKEELIFSTYSFVDDESGRDIMAALLNAAERGVRVRMVVDGVTALSNLKLSEDFKALSGADNVEVRVYNPVNLLKPWKLNYRMHDKYLIADDRVYILGGRNTKNLSLGDYQEKKDIDRDIVVYGSGGSSLSQLKEYFSRVWELDSTKAFHSLRRAKGGAENLRDRYESLRKLYPEAYTATDWESSTIPTNGVRLLTNSPKAQNKEPLLWSSVIELMSMGEDRIVQTPYLICNGQMYEDLAKLTGNGKKTEIILNSASTGANVFGCSDYLNQKENILNTGADIYEYSLKHSSHAKTVLVDNNISLVGSFNFDIRSAYLNTELMLVIDCPQLNGQLRSTAQAQKDASLHLSPDEEPAEGPDYVRREMSFSKRMLYELLKIIVWPVRHLI